MEELISFSKVLQNIKTKTNFSNESLAHYLDCSPSSVSRYLSNKLDITFDRLVTFKNNLNVAEHIDLCEFIFESYPTGFYHGSKIGLNGAISPTLNKNKTLDFGLGFYLGTSFKQSSMFVVGVDNGNDRIYRFSLSLENLKCLELVGPAWVLYVAYNRGMIPNIKSNQRILNEMRKINAMDYDVIYGPIADDKMALSMENFFSNRITFKQLMKCVTRLDIGNQYCLKTKKACDHLRLEAIYRCEDPNIRGLINQDAIDAYKEAANYAEIINAQKERGERFLDLLKEYEHKPIF